MEKGTKIILTLIGIAILITVGIKYMQFYIYKDFTFLTQVDCNPATEACFKLLEENQDFETNIIYYDGSPYKYVEMPATIAPACLEETTCQDFTCDQVGGGCETYFCDVNDEESYDPEWEECVGVPYEEIGSVEEGIE
jgi:hypothetical protein